MNKFRSFLFAYLLLFSLNVHASFIEATIGKAVVNDATATFYNPAALTLLKNSQIITLGSVAYFNSHFVGQAIQPATGFIQSGSSRSRTHYYLPSLYIGIPVGSKVVMGLAIISNDFNRDVEANSVLRYVQSSNNIQDIDLVPGIGFKFNEFFSLGLGVTVSSANFLLRPISGIPGLNIPDSQSRNEASGTGWGADVGFLLKPSQATVIGFNYRSAIFYPLSGTSIISGRSQIFSNHYRFTFWTPASGVLSVNYFLTPSLGFIGTIQRIYWDIFREINLRDVAVQVGSETNIVRNAKVPYHLHNTWLLTLGSHYHITPQWILRVAGTYNQSPGNGKFQVDNGDSITAGVSMSYEFYKKFIIDGSYAHSFIKDKNINIATARNLINGVNKGFRDAFSLKLTFNV